MLKKTINQSDVVLYILDARFVNVSKKVVDICKQTGKNLILVLNKADLVSEKESDDVGIPYAYFSCKYPGKYKKHLERMIYSLSRAKNMDLIKVAVVGYPNVGKSSVINALSHRHALSVSPEAGHTKSVQWLKWGRILLSDTPGVIPERTPKEKLVLTGSLNIEREADPVGICEKLLESVFSAGGARALFAHFDIAPCARGEVIRALALRRGRLMKGGEPNLEEAARMIVSEWQRGKIRLG